MYKIYFKKREWLMKKYTVLFMASPAVFFLLAAARFWRSTYIALWQSSLSWYALCAAFLVGLIVLTFTALLFKENTGAKYLKQIHIAYTVLFALLTLLAVVAVNIPYAYIYMGFLYGWVLPSNFTLISFSAFIYYCILFTVYKKQKHTS